MGYISAKEGARITGYTQQHITALARERRITAKRLNEKSGVWLIDRDSLIAYANQAKDSDDERYGPG